jgi:hypothetical protein
MAGGVQAAGASPNVPKHTKKTIPLLFVRINGSIQPRR